MRNSIAAWIAFLVLLLNCLACNNNSPSVSDVERKDTLEIWADTSLRILINEQKKAFENSYTNPLLKIRYLQESGIVENLMNNNLNCAILQRNLRPNESNYLKDKEDFTPKQYTIAYDAFVFVTNKKNPIDVLSVPSIGNYFKKGKSTDFQLVFESNHCQAIPYFQSYYNLSAGQVSSAFTKSSLSELMTFLRSDTRSVGIIPFSYISDIEASSTVELLKDLKVLSVNYADSLKVSRTINPSQESITTKEYPFVMPIVLLNCNMEKKSGTTFVNYILKPKAQRLFLKCGLVPAIFPAREVKVNTN